jgi:hypothetical protein
MTRQQIVACCCCCRCCRSFAGEKEASFLFSDTRYRNEVMEGERKWRNLGDYFCVERESDREQEHNGVR